MKSMLYAGAALMIGASIYGFVDYRQTHNKKEFKEMYSEKKTNAPVIPAKEAAKTEMQEKTTVAPVTLVVSNNKAVNSAVKTPAKEKKLAVQKKKKIRKEFFSRGRMPEEVLIEPVKKETKKTESKEL